MSRAEQPCDVRVGEEGGGVRREGGRGSEYTKKIRAGSSD